MVGKVFVQPIHLIVRDLFSGYYLHPISNQSKLNIDKEVSSSPGHEIMRSGQREKGFFRERFSFGAKLTSDRNCRPFSLEGVSGGDDYRRWEIALHNSNYRFCPLM